MAKIKKLMTRADIIRDIDTNITPLYFPNETLDRNRAGTYGWFTETLAESIEDNLMMEQTRSADYCPELSNNEIHVNQTAKIRGVTAARAVPGTCYAVLGILKSDIVSKGVRVSDVERRFLVDRRSTILYGQVNFSLEDDIVIRAVLRDNRYYYTANYTMEHATSGVMDQYLQVYEYTSTQGEEVLGMVVRLHQCRYTISDQTVIDNVEFIYDGLYFDYSNQLAGFEVYYKASPTDPEYTKAKLDNYLTTASALDKCLYYNDDETGLLKIMNNPYLGLTTNSVIRVEIRETLGEDGNITLNGVDSPTFSMYQDAAYNYSGVYVYINMLTDTTGGQNGDTLTDIKKRLIDAKTRRSNITTEHDIISYINDIDANIQLERKRNDVQDRNYYMYTLVRDSDRTIAPATTKPLILNGPISADNPGDFDVYNAEVKRKLLRANNRFRLHVVSNGQDGDYVTKVPLDTPEVTIVDPTELPDINQYELGTILRVRHSTVNGYSDKTYTVSTRHVGTCTSNSVIYLKDDVDSMVLTPLPNGAVVTVDETGSTDDFYAVTYGRISGYVVRGDINYSGEIERYYEPSFYLTCPYMIVVDDLDIASYYFNSVDDEAVLSIQSTNSFFPLQMISRSVQIYRDAHAARTYASGYDVVEGQFGMFPDEGDPTKTYVDIVSNRAYVWNGSSYDRIDDEVVLDAPNIYTFTIKGTMNTENDELLVDSEYNIIDKTAVMCYLFFTVDDDIVAYLPMSIDSYDSSTREFSFVGKISTSDYITEQEKLEITSGLYQIGGDAGGAEIEYNSVVDFHNAAFTVGFMYKEGEAYTNYLTSDPIFGMIPSSRLVYEIVSGATGTALTDLDLYESPNSESAVLATIGNTTTFPIDVDQSVLGWFHVTYGEVEGYVDASLVQYEETRVPGGYVLMDTYHNNSNNLYDLILEFGKFTRSPVVVANTGGASQNVRSFGPVVSTEENIDTALRLIRLADSEDEAAQSLVETFGIDATAARYVLSNKIKMLQHDTVTMIRKAWDEANAVPARAIAEVTMHATPSEQSDVITTIEAGTEVTVNYVSLTDGWYRVISGDDDGWCLASAFDLEGSGTSTTQYTIKSVPFFEYHYGVEKTASLYDVFQNMVTTYSSLLKLTADFEVALKFTATYGPSKYITITGGRDTVGAEVIDNLANLNPTLYFKVYGVNVPLDDVYNYIYEYIRDTYITDAQLFMSNICTLVEDNFSSVTSIKFMGVDDFDASYQQFTYNKPDFETTDAVARFVPEQLNVSDIRIELVETRI